MGDMENAVPETEELPRTIVRHLVKDKLSRCYNDGDISLFQFTKMLSLLLLKAHGSSFTTFRQGLTTYAKRQILNADDIFKALEETEFHEFVQPLKASLEEFRRKNAGKKQEHLRLKK